MIEQRAAADVRAWRPQRFGHAKTGSIRDPIVEPLWIGERILARVAGGSAALVDESGEALDVGVAGDELADVRDAIEAGVLASSAVLDGYLTRQAKAGPGDEVDIVTTPTASEITTQLLFGLRRSARKELQEDDRAAAEIHAAPVPLALVAVDLLEVDGSALLDVPLLERKRLLESTIAPSDLLRVGPYVRPPVDTWFRSWSAIGFLEAAFKAANSRYRPGVVNDDWTTLRIPKR